MAETYTEEEKNELERAIQVLGEDEPNIITYSQSMPVSVTRLCQNKCPYCSFTKKDNLMIPYSTIKHFKKARLEGAREAFFMAGEKPDRHSQVRALLDLWGFESYVDYLYTLCELSFLEGLIPVTEVGFLSPKELKRIQEIVAINKVMLDCIDKDKPTKYHPHSPGKKLDIRLKTLEWMGRLKFPAITGILVGIGETKTQRNYVLNEIAKLQKTYGHIHEVLIQNHVPQKNTPMGKLSPLSHEQMLEYYELARGIIPEEVPVTIPVDANIDHIESFVKAGLRDLGRIFQGKGPYAVDKVDMDDLETRMEKLGFTLQQRFPLRKEFIRDEWYSKKLGQVFDSYKYKIKKEGQEKVKSARLRVNGA